MGTFRAARGGGVRIRFDANQAQVLRSLLGELLELLDERDDETAGPSGPPEDPLAAELGIGTATTTPEDPVLARLFPDGYTDDEEGSADFRRYTEQGLRRGKRAAARTAMGTLDQPGRTQHLDGDQARAWLAALTDLRLAMGTRLEVTEEWDHDLDAFELGDPRRVGFAVYDHLAYLQETLVHAINR